MKKRKAILLNEKDNVAVALSALRAGEDVGVEIGGCETTVRLLDSIPRGHKFAIREIVQGEDVVKYGEAIGVAKRRIGKGEHVHTHNLVSKGGAIGVSGL